MQVIRSEKQDIDRLFGAGSRHQQSQSSEGKGKQFHGWRFQIGIVRAALVGVNRPEHAFTDSVVLPLHRHFSAIAPAR